MRPAPRVRTLAFWVPCAVVLLGALAITVCRLVEPGGRLGLALVAFTPLALPAYAVVVLLVAARLVVLRRRRRPLRWVLPVAVVALAGLVVHAWWFAPQVSGANPPPAAGAPTLVVMTSNLRMGEGDGLAVVRAVSREDVDLLVLEELTPARLAAMDRAGLADLLPYRVGQAHSGAAGTMAFARRPLTDPVRLDTGLGSWAFTMAGESGDPDSTSLRVLGVHPAYPVESERWHRDAGVLARAVTAQRPDLMLGDFNATMDHAPMRALADRGYRDVGELANDGWRPTWPSHGAFALLGTPLAQIDYVLVGPRLAALGMRTLDVPDTDHRAVIARVAAK